MEGATRLPLADTCAEGGVEPSPVDVEATVIAPETLKPPVWATAKVDVEVDDGVAAADAGAGAGDEVVGLDGADWTGPDRAGTVCEAAAETAVWPTDGGVSGSGGWSAGDDGDVG